MTMASARCAMLRRLQSLCAILIRRFGSHTSLGELNAALIAHLAIYTHRPLTVTEIANRSGQPKQSISRWFRMRPQIRLRVKPDDARGRLVDSDDPIALTTYVDEVIALRTLD